MIKDDRFKFTDAYNRRYGYPRKAHYSIERIREYPKDVSINAKAVDAVDLNETQKVTAKPVAYCFHDVTLERETEEGLVIWTRLDGVDIEEVELVAEPVKKILAKREVVTPDLRTMGIDVEEGTVSLSDDDLADIRRVAANAGDDIMVRTVDAIGFLDKGEDIPYDAGTEGIVLEPTEEGWEWDKQ